jgi:adenylate cyclase
MRKGDIAEPVRAYSVQVGSPPPAKPEEPRAEFKPLALPDRPSIAVLAFQTMGGDAEQEYFADGMVEDIITGLSRIKWLFVIARNSSFAYKGKSVDIRQVARELGVRYVLEGSVRKAGGRLRVNAQLIDADNGTHVWADRYDGALDDVFEFQDRITETIVGIIEPNVRRAEIERARRKRPDSLDAYDLLLQATPHFASAMPEDVQTAIPLLERALKLDPHYALAHALMAMALESRFARGGYKEADAAASERHARMAVAYGADDSTALAVASLPLLMVAHDFEAASSAVRRALDLNPSCATALFFGAQAHAEGGDHALAEEYATRALRLSPLDPQSFMAFNALGMVRGLAGRLDEAVSFFSQAVQANPRFSTLYVFLAAALVHAGRADEAATAASRLLATQPDFNVSSFRRFGSGFCRKDVLDWLSAGILKAGLPE